MTRFGDFAPLCSSVPSFPWCNFFYAQVQNLSPDTLTGLSSVANVNSAPVGVNISCGIPRSSTHPNIANIVICGISIIITLALEFVTNRRKAAVGRAEFRIFLFLYFVSLCLQLVDTGSFLTQGTKQLVAVTSIHAGVVTALFAVLLANAGVAMQVVEDGTSASLVPTFALLSAFLGATIYISLDTAFNYTDALGKSNPPEALHSIPMFVLLIVWPAVCAFLYFAIMIYTVVFVLKEIKPAIIYLVAAVLFILSQLAYFLLSKVVCSGTNGKTDGSFIATLLETATVAVIWYAWRTITVESWEEHEQYDAELPPHATTTTNDRPMEQANHNHVTSGQTNHVANGHSSEMTDSLEQVTEETHAH